METKEHRILHQYGDRELWTAEADDKSWSLPLYVEWRHDKENDVHYAHVLPAVCLYNRQALTLISLLQPHDIQGKKTNWVIPRRICEAILHKATGITPLYYYRWPDDGCPPPIERTALEIDVETRTPKASRPTYDSFVQWLSKERKIPSSIINAVMAGIAHDGPIWMLQHRKPLDLGFCRLLATPFRANWKQIVAFKFKHKKLRGLLALPEDERWKALEEAGLPDTLTSPHNVALRRGRKSEEDVARIDYTIEAIASDTFETIANRIEGRRMARGGAAYITEFEETVAALYQSLALAMRSYLAKVAAPYAEVRNRGSTGIFGFVPVLGRKQKVRHTPLTALPIQLIASDSGFSVFGSSDDYRLVQASFAKVPKVPNLLQDSPDVRGCTEQGDVDRPELNGDTTIRLPVLATGKSCDEGESVLVITEDTGDGLDPERDNGAMI